MLPYRSHFIALGNAQVIAGNPDKAYHEGRIKIESNEQFVPLMLAYYGLHESATPINTYTMYDKGGGKHIRGREPLSRTADRERDKPMILSALKKILDLPLPKEYSICEIIEPGGYREIRSYPDSVFFSTAKYGTPSVYSVNGLLQFAGLGILGICRNPHINNNGGNLWLGQNYAYPMSRIYPEVICLIKYKYLKIARASLFLKTKLDIPHDGIKMMRVTNFFSSYINEYYRTIIAPIVKELDMIVEFTSVEELRKYVCNRDSEPKSASKFLEDARRAFQHPEPSLTY